METEYEYKDYNFCVKDTWSTEEDTLEQVDKKQVTEEINPKASKKALSKGKGTKEKKANPPPKSGCWTCLPRDKKGIPSQVDPFIWKGNEHKHQGKCVARIDPDCKSFKKHKAKTKKKAKEDAALEKQTCKYCGWFHRDKKHFYKTCKKTCKSRKKAMSKSGPVSIKKVDSVCPAECDILPITPPGEQRSKNK